jgi:hypothetical protein
MSDSQAEEVAVVGVLSPAMGSREAVGRRAANDSEYATNTPGVFAAATCAAGDHSSCGRSAKAAGVRERWTNTSWAARTCRIRVACHQTPVATIDRKQPAA